MLHLEAATHRLIEPFQKDGLVIEKPDTQGSIQASLDWQNDIVDGRKKKPTGAARFSST